MHATHDGTVLHIDLHSGPDPCFVISGRGRSFGIGKGTYPSKKDILWFNKREARAIAQFIKEKLEEQGAWWG